MEMKFSFYLEKSENFLQIKNFQSLNLMIESEPYSLFAYGYFK